MVKLDYHIRLNLPTNLVEAIKILDELDSLQIPPLLLKNHPGIVQTLCKLKVYVGKPTEYSDKTAEQKVTKNFTITLIICCRCVIIYWTIFVGAVRREIKCYSE